MKKTYETPEVDITKFSLNDVLLSSYIEEPEVPAVTDYTEPSIPDGPRG